MSDALSTKAVRLLHRVHSRVTVTCCSTIKQLYDLMPRASDADSSVHLIWSSLYSSCHTLLWGRESIRRVVPVANGSGSFLRLSSMFLSQARWRCFCSLHVKADDDGRSGGQEKEDLRPHKYVFLTLP